MTKEALKQAIIKEWNRLNQKYIQRLIDSMPRRIRECWLREGKPTPY